MRTIDLGSWPRRSHFETYRDAHVPHFNVCADVDVTDTRLTARSRGVPVTAAIVYVTARSANEIPEFRRRIRGETVIEHDLVHPSMTVMGEGGLFGFCFFDYQPDFPAFVEHYEQTTARAKRDPNLSDPPGRDDLLFMTAIPWVSFTSFMHPVVAIPVDSIPRLAWGGFKREGDRVRMPLSVQGHHSLMDGLHVGQYFERVQRYFSNPESFVTTDRR